MNADEEFEVGFNSRGGHYRLLKMIFCMTSFVESNEQGRSNV